MGALIWPLLGVFAGAIVATQAPVNAALARDLGMPIAAAAVSFAIGAAALTLLATLVAPMQGISLNWRAPAPWLFVMGGLLGATFVTCNIILAPKLGAAALMAFMVAGQLLAGLLLDRIGFLGLAVREISLGRVTGAAMLLCGALLIRFT
jgi:transporter family-2 protein